jgi:hypothetical protein
MLQPLCWHYGRTTLTILYAPALAMHGRAFPRLDCANYGGITNRLRSLLTCSAFSEAPPHVFWDGHWPNAKQYDYPLAEARRIFAFPFATATVPLDSDAPVYDDWLVLTPDILCAGRSTAAMCMDALNGDGLKSAEMLYQLPDGVYLSLQKGLLEMFSGEYRSRLSQLTAICRNLRYAVISFRFWSECEAAFWIHSDTTRLNLNWNTPKEFEGVCDSITRSKWLRVRPSRASLRAARSWLREQNFDNVVFMSERWNGATFCLGKADTVRDAVLTGFAPGLERQIANMFVIANASALWRSKDSTYTHLPVLLGPKWGLRVLDV